MIPDNIQYCPFGNVFSNKDYKTTHKSVPAGEYLCTTSPHGYDYAYIDGKPTFAHRIAFEKMGFDIPDGMFVDHIDGDKSNNRWDNLRLVTIRENNQNRDTHRNGKHLGVHKSGNGSYTSHICLNGKQQYLGTFPTSDLAQQAYLAKLKQIGESKPLHTDQDTWDKCPSFEEIYEKRNTSASSTRRRSKGYYFHKANKKYHVQIMVDRKKIHIGYFQTEEEAREAYLKATKEYV